MTEHKSALEVIRSHQMAAPVDVHAIARNLGLRIRSLDLGENVGGRIKRAWSGGYEVHVNERDHPRRQRFTIAHEIAHFVMHRDLIGDGITEDALFRGPWGDPHVETQANRLAADILMPYFLIQIYWLRAERSVDQLARRFDVSKQAMEIRLEGFRRSAVSWPAGRMASDTGAAFPGLA
ncbi:ImmA/IrrE family metallo-endopeptidase [Thalassobaculum sp.]|uniref:ImmA/IrrE family metallo-endopeptidase n=1 Tax=Thalassobaculum sp. TaxID=2022740 RepID=UPI0032EEEC90